MARLCYRPQVSGDDGSGSSLEARTQAFLSEFFDRGQELVRDLIEENEALRSRLVAVESDHDPTGALVHRLRKQVAELEAECERVRAVAGNVAQESGGYRERLEELEVAHYHLAARQVSAEQLRQSTTLDEVVRSTTEILLNLVGVGRFTVFAIDPERGLFSLRAEGHGDDAAADISLDEDHPAAHAASASRPWSAGHETPRTLDPMLALPLLSGERAVGVVWLERFLPQKKEFTDDDFGLLELISTESGAALDAAWLRAHARQVPFSRAEVEALLG